ncbi:HAD-like domain-containing protein [Desarmillaria tabescens]|uniref:HAD-like domain-containing protein n=1 Tax=Armillaria tabescens TaxID=1929756 RepID=A0AA39KBT7_ARMTA|nr:HAD-like domain-containing protein [Desarmillaria tabescens]KAK0458271.1 HAD-like domain-containing protein [Desarmillaria tabescens]
MEGVEALVFDVFGTVVDWRGSVSAELKALGKNLALNADWDAFAAEWRKGYLTNTSRIAREGSDSGPLNVDVLHRQILDDMLNSPRWVDVGSKLDEKTRAHLNLVWHRLNGWPDTVEGLYQLKKHVILTTLSNGNVRLLVDMAKHANLPWDLVLSTELFSCYKPNPEAYLGAIKHLSVPPEKCAMVGMKTVYVQRPGEAAEDVVVKPSSEGGEVDVVVQSFIELASLLSQTH